MRIIISPAKKMTSDDVTLPWADLPEQLPRTQVLLDRLRRMSPAECQKLWGCSQSLAELNYARLQSMDLQGNLSPALLSYVGIQYQYMAAGLLNGESYEYLQEHLRILSGFYGVLRPLDGVTPYRLEMQAKLQVESFPDLYAFWGSSLYEQVMDESRVVINLASKEYSRCIQAHLQPGDAFVDVVFGELVGGEPTGGKLAGGKLAGGKLAGGKVAGGKVVQKGTFAKMARGEMVRYLAKQDAQSPEAMKGFDALGFRFAPELSDSLKYVFLRNS